MLSPRYGPLQLGHTAQDVGAQGEPLQGGPPGSTPTLSQSTTFPKSTNSRHWQMR